jgi:hypothetical protein
MQQKRATHVREVSHQRWSGGEGIGGLTEMDGIESGVERSNPEKPWGRLSAPACVVYISGLRLKLR